MKARAHTPVGESERDLAAGFYASEFSRYLSPDAQMTPVPKFISREIELQLVVLGCGCQGLAARIAPKAMSAGLI